MRTPLKATLVWAEIDPHAPEPSCERSTSPPLLLTLSVTRLLMLGLNGDARALRLTPGTPHALGDGRVGQGANTAFENAIQQLARQENRFEERSTARRAPRLPVHGSGYIEQATGNPSL
jgi:hypothetical protein